MKTFNTYFLSETELHAFIDMHQIVDSEQLLIQVFSAKNDFKFLSRLTHFFNNHFPLSTLIGSTTDGEIKDGYVSTQKTVISFTRFDNVTLRSCIKTSSETYDKIGIELSNKIIHDDTRVIIAFIDGLSGNGEAFLEGIHSLHPEIVIAGGLAGDNATFSQTFVFTKEAILTGGVAAVSLSSPTLKVYTDYSFNWKPIGKKLTITHADENRVYTINEKTAVETYNYYLGQEIGNQLPYIGIEFPLIVERDGYSVARAAIAKESDGSLLFAGNLKNGEEVRFGFGDADTILGDTQKHIDRLNGHGAESIFIYSCMARRRFLPLEIEHETLIYNQIAPTCGFFTYGEFFSKELLNQSMTVLALSESETPFETNVCYYHSHHKSTTIHALSHLVSISVNELETLQDELKSLSITDPLTGLHNRRYFEEISKTIFHLASRNSNPLCAIMADIDKFKTINDTYGHDSGDIVLVKISKILQNSLRKSDFICRYGGEEFVILLPNTDRDDGIFVAEEIRQKIESYIFNLDDGKTLYCTVSLGISEYDNKRDHAISRIIKRADIALYNAKSNGRNRVEFN
jgi:c-di-GMP phosphodiesterase